MKGYKPLVIAFAVVLGFIMVFPLGEANISYRHNTDREKELPAGTTRAWSGTDDNVLWVRSDDRYNESYYYLDVESRVQAPGLATNPQMDNANVNISHTSEATSVNFRYPKLASNMPPLNSPYNSNIEPYVELWVNSQDHNLRIIDLIIEFDLSGDGSYEYTAEFTNYTTKKLNQYEKAIFNFDGWEGGNEPNGPMVDGAVRLRVWREDNIAEDPGEPPFQIYCGFYNLTSWIGLPYEVPDVMPFADIAGQGKGEPERIEDVDFDDPVTLDASNSSEPEGQALEYRWIIKNLDPDYDDTDNIPWTGNAKTQYTFVPPLVEQDNKSYHANFSVKLQVRDPDNHYDQDTVIYFVEMKDNWPPQIETQNANLKKPVIGQEVTFTATASDKDDPDGDLEFKWDFGDGDVTSYVSQGDDGGVVAHEFDSADEYTVTVYCRDLFPAEVSRQMSLTVYENEEPAAVIKEESENIDMTTLEGGWIVNLKEVVTVTAEDSTDDSYPQIFSGSGYDHNLFYRWTTGEGDGGSDTKLIDPDDENKDGDGWVTYTSFSFNYSSTPGGDFYTLNLEVADGDPEGASGSLVKIGEASQNIFVNSPPTPTFTFSTSGDTPIYNDVTEVTFDARNTVDINTYDDLESLNFIWEFGDGSSDSGMGKYNVTHKYNQEFDVLEAEKKITVTLYAKDSQGAQGQFSRVIKILPQPEEPVAVGYVGEEGSSEAEVYTQKDIRFMGYDSYDKDLFGGGVVLWWWDLDTSRDSDGDGNPANDHDAEGANYTHQYNKPGEYKINLIVQDSQGLKDSLAESEYLTVKVLNQIPVVPKLKTVQGITEYEKGMMITFDATTSYDPDNQDAAVNGIVRFEWFFDDDNSPDNTTNNGTCSHKFKDTGTKTVRVRAYDSDGDYGENSIDLVIVKPKDDTDNGDDGPGFEAPLAVMVLVAVAVISLAWRRR